MDALEMSVTGRIDTSNESLGLRIGALGADHKTMLEESIHAHARWMIAMWTTVIASQIDLWLR